MAEVAVVGGGLAGAAAAVALAEAGVRIILLEKRATLGGRACSLAAPGWATSIDNCQHVLLGCCTALLDFYRRLGVDRTIEWHAKVTLVAADGRRGALRSYALPAPLHLAPALLTIPALRPVDRWSLAVALARILFSRQAPEGRSFRDWLAPLTTARLDRGLWRLLLTSVLNADAHHVSARYGRMFVVEGLLRNPVAPLLGVPRVPLGALHHEAVLRRLAALGAEVRTGCATTIELCRGRVVGLRLGRERLAVKNVISAVRWSQLPGLLGAAARVVAGPAVERLESAPLVGVHLGYDEPVGAEPVVGLLEGEIDWIFRLEGGRHLSLVRSDAGPWEGLSTAEMVRRGLAAARTVWPDLPDPARVAACRERVATFVPAPGVERLRPGPVTGLEGLYLAGEWTATGWPSTMEGAVRSGYRAAEAVLTALGRPTAVAPPGLPARGLMRWLPASQAG